jgi:DNA-binding transcriptional LysR family regulator
VSSISQIVSASIINLHQLRVFVEVVESEGFTRAAARLSMTQPAVSAQVEHLRNIAGAPLLVRDGRRVVLTEVGKVMYEYARDVLASTDAMQRRVSEIATGETDQLVVAANRSYSSILLPPVVTRFGLEHPGLRITIVQAVGADFVELVRSGRVDAGIFSGKPVPDDLAPIHLGSDRLLVVEASSAPFSRGRSLTPAELVTLPFLRSSITGAYLTAGMDRLLAQHGLPRPRVVLDAPTWHGVHEAALSGLGLAVLYRSVVRNELEQGTLRVVEVMGHHDVRDVYLMCSPQRQRLSAPVFRRFVEALRQEMVETLDPGQWSHSR